VFGKNGPLKEQLFTGSTKRGFADLKKTAILNTQKCVKCSNEIDWPNSKTEDVMESA
jgi:hypothetical protein